MRPFTTLARPATWPFEVLAYPPKVLTQKQRKSYFKHGTLLLEGFVSEEWIEKLNKTTQKYVDLSRDYDASSKEGQSDMTSDASDELLHHLVFAPGHTRDRPRLTRLISPHDVDPIFWEWTTSLACDIAEDLLGPDIKFHHSKLNFKPGAVDGAGGSSIAWHQDIQFWPHTNYTPLTIGVYLQDVTEEMGPMRVVPLSCHDELHPLDDDTGNWTGVLAEDILARVPLERAVYPTRTAKAGTITVHNARCVHGSESNTSPRDRPLLLNTYTAATAHPLPFGTNLIHARAASGRQLSVIRGEPTRWAVFDPRPCPMAPNFEAGYSAPFFETDKGRVPSKRSTVVNKDG